MKDMRNVYSKSAEDLVKILSEIPLNQQQKSLVLIAMEFGYSAAFCSRTCDMNGNIFQEGRYDGRYDGGYDSMKKLVEMKKSVN